MAETKKKNRMDVFDLLGDEVQSRAAGDERVKTYIAPKRIIWKSEGTDCSVENEQRLLENVTGQIGLVSDNPCVMKNKGGQASVLLDFGFEMQGGVQILAWSCGEPGKANVRVRFGESAAEAMSELGGEKNATNNHSPRDITIEIPALSGTEAGCTGFRFIRIDLLGSESELTLKAVRAAFTYRDLEYKGSFRCSDELVNRIWNTGAYTVHLNMQSYLWDGIKRDRLVWVGDIYPETATLYSVFGSHDIVAKSLDFARDETPLPGWMNGIPTYSMWWIVNLYQYFLHGADKKYLRTQKEYLLKLIDQLSEHIGEDGRDTTPGFRFIDWPSSPNQTAVDAGIQALHVLAAKAAAALCDELKCAAAAKKCRADVEKLLRCRPDANGCKAAGALMAMAGLAEPAEINRALLSKDGAHGISTFLGYFVLQARAAAGDVKGGLDCMREYWGGMLKMGATTFWEDFNLDWMEGAPCLDELPKQGQKDIHGDNGGYCYQGYRHSLCHGWASGPTAWLTENVLGVQIMEPGCRTIRVAPQLGDLKWVEGTFPTPKGIIRVRAEKTEDGKTNCTVTAPSGIKIIQQ